MCGELMADVPLPAVDARTDARVAFARDDAALIEAKKRLANGRGCVGEVRRRYQGGAK